MIRYMRLAFRYLMYYPWLLAANLVMLLLSSAFEGLGIGLMIPILQTMIGQNDENIFIRYAEKLFELLHLPYGFMGLMIFFCGVMLLKYTGIAVQQTMTRRLCARTKYDLRTRAYGRLLRAPLPFYYRHKTGDLITTIYTSANNAGAVHEMMIHFMVSVVFFLTYMIINCIISVPLTMLVTTIAAIAYFFILPKFRIGFIQGQEEKKAADQLTSSLHDTISGIKTIKTYGREAHHNSIFIQIAETYRKLDITIQNNRIIAHLFLEPFIMVMIVTLIIISVTVFNMSAIALLTFFYIFSRTLPHLRFINNYYLQIMNLLPHFAKVEELIEDTFEAEEKGGAIRINEFFKEIRCTNLSFSYPMAESLCLKQITLTIPKHSVTALVGSSGGGKSTLIDLLLCLHSPTEGSITVDGTALSEVRRDDWLALIGSVSQDAFLFNETIYDNIKYAKPEATNEEIEYAARMAYAHDFIVDLPFGYKTIVGERGMMLSGGQKQRIALARAFLKDPAIIILDEATSALDSESEQAIKNALLKVRDQKTIIIVAHRISSITYADTIVVIEDGQVVEQGSHDVLMKHKGLYYNYSHLQTIE